MKRITYEEAQGIMMWENSYSRLEKVLSLYPKMQSHEWRQLLGNEWTGCDNIAAFRLSVKRIIGTDGPIKEMMDDEEQAAFNLLPDTVTVYRGCGERNKLGASWSLDQNIAAKFPFLQRYSVPDPMLITGRVKKKNIIAVKLDRGESEIITFSARRISMKPLTARGGVAASDF